METDVIIQQDDTVSEFTQMFNDTISTNHCCETFQKLRTKFKNKCLGKVTDGIILLHDNACPHVAHKVQGKLNAMQ
jgi:hypothetical protein